MNQGKKWAAKVGLAVLLIPAALHIGTDTTFASVQSNKIDTAVTQSVKAATDKVVTIKAYNLNIRADASFSSKIVGVAKQGETYTVIQTSNGLHQIGPNQWISANQKYVTDGNGSNVQSTNNTVAKQTNDAVSSKNTTTSVPATSPATSAPATSVSSNESSKQNISAIVNIAKQYIGTPYKWGGTTPSGFDCSGFVSYVYKQAGYNISNMNTTSWWNKVQKVSSPQIGDLVFLQNTYKNGVSHVGIYIGGGQMIHAGSDKVEISNLSNSYYKNHFLGYGRL